jgi:hypothetical protein
VYVRAALYDTAGGFYAAHSRHLDPPQVKSLGADEYAHSWGAESAPPDAGHPYATPPRGTSIRC